MHENMELTAATTESRYVEPKNKYEDGENSGSEYDEDQAEVEKIVDVMFKKGDLHYKVRWVNFTPKDDTWEPEVNFLGDESKAILRRFKTKNHRKIANILKREDKKKKKRKDYWAAGNNEDSSRNSYSHKLKPRELSKEDEFYGQKAAATKGEVKGLFDPSHKYSATELFLSTTDPTLKITRSQTRCLLGEDSLNRVKALVNYDNELGGAEIIVSETKPALVHAPEEQSTKCVRNSVFDNGENSCSSEKWKFETDITEMSAKSVGESLRRRLVHLLPCSVSLNEKVTKVTMSQMLGEQELKHYGEERSVSQQKFNEDVLSGDFMRFRRALYQNIAYGLRLLTWTNARGASLLHILCRDVKCTDTHSADDAADMLCKFAHGVVTANDFDGRIPLHEAVQRGQVCRVNILLKYHSPVNVVDNAGLTPLDMAYRKNHAKMVKVLLMAGANFSALETTEKRKRNEDRRSRAFDVLRSHSSNVRYLLTRTRRKVYRYILDRRTVSPCFIAPFSDGPNFMFQFSFSSEINLFKNQGYVLFLYVCSKSRGPISRDQWIARCWGGLSQSSLPMLNGLPVKPIHFRKGMMNSHMIFLVLPVVGKNVLEVFLNVDEVLKPCILAAQIVLVERVAREHRRLPFALSTTLPILEKTPNIGPMF